MARSFSPVLILLLTLGLPLFSACGQNRHAEPAGPLLPEYYVIAPEDVPAVGAHLRYAAAGTRAGGLDIAVTEYIQPKSGSRVTLFGVVHVADPPYYAEVARRLATYDVVLYEGVKSAGLSAAEWQAGFNRGRGDVASLQAKLARWFGFQYQLDALDYAVPNFVHADMTEEEFLAGGGGVLLPGRAAARKKGEGRGSSDPDYGMGDRSLTQAVGSTLQAVERFGADLLDKPSVFRSMGRQMFAETMGTADIGSALDMFPGLSELILTKRNDVVMLKLKQVLVEHPATVAIFYGAAHMQDLENRLQEDLGYARARAVWLRAWALRPALRR